MAALEEGSLVPRLFGGGGKKEPGIYCLRMRLIILTFQIFWFLQVRPCYTDVTTLASPAYFREMDRSIVYALERLTASVTLKDEQTACVKAI